VNADEKAMIEELKVSLSNKIQRSLVNAYLEKPDAESILTQALVILERVSTKNETS
jgi:hypothetical protein